MKIIIPISCSFLLIGWIASCQPSISNEERLEQLAKKVTVRIFSANPSDRVGGSGVLIDSQENQYLVITNDHVVSNRQLVYQIQTFDGKTYPARILSPRQSYRENDLALLKFQAPFPYKILKIPSKPRIFKDDPVLAGGFPFSDDLEQTTHFYSTQGKVTMVLDQPFIGGYGIGYTNLVRGGMSGGPVINQKGELLGINGMDKNPLFGNPYIFPDGKTVSEAAWREVSQLSWSIPSQTIQQFIQKYREPGAKNAPESR